MIGKACAMRASHVLWIAATALSRGITVVTQDKDFEAVADVAGLSVVRV
jgi:predicted nucleic acid-binding protein